MIRQALVSTFVLAMLATSLEAQEAPSSSGPPSLFGSKLDQFRRTLLGEQSSSNNGGHSSAVGSGSNAANSPTLAPPRVAARPAPVSSPSSFGPPTGRMMLPGGSSNDDRHQVAAPRVGSQPATAAAPRTSTPSTPQSQMPSPSPISAAPSNTMTGSSLLPPAFAADAKNNGSAPAAAPTSNANVAAPTTNEAPLNNLRQPSEAMRPVLSTRDVEPLRNDISSDSSSRVQRPNATRSVVNPLKESSSAYTPNDNQVLVARRSPSLSVEATGPKRITVGKEAVYIVKIRNAGDSPANDVIVHVAIPDFAEVVEARATNGSTGTPNDGSSGLQWKLNTINGQVQDELQLKIVPRRSEPFDLGLRYSYAPALTTTTVEVQEPRLEMAVSGPKDVVFGEQHTYKLTISNPGTGDADNVIVQLIPLTPSEGSTTTHRVGTLPAGASRSLEIELTARQAGQISIRTEATADGGLKASAAEQVWVRRAGLDVSVTGPQTHYAGVPASYEIRVRNSGDAVADKVAIAAMLPSDAEILSTTSGAEPATGGHQTTWKIDHLAPNGEQVFVVKCAMRSGGANRVEATATAVGDLRATNVASTEVIAVADLALEVNDSAGPVPVGQETVYDVRVRNRGTSSADEVEMVVFFSNGVEPTSVEGGLHEINPGMVLFRNIPSLAAGSEVTYKIRAKASAAGAHRIRVELQCRSLGTKLTQEDSTLFYSDEPLNVAREPQPKPAAVPGGDRY